MQKIPDAEKVINRSELWNLFHKINRRGQNELVAHYAYVAEDSILKSSSVAAKILRGLKVVTVVNDGLFLFSKHSLGAVYRGRNKRKWNEEYRLKHWKLSGSRKLPLMHFYIPAFRFLAG